MERNHTYHLTVQPSRFAQLQQILAQRSDFTLICTYRTGDGLHHVVWQGAPGTDLELWLALGQGANDELLHGSGTSNRDH